MLGLEQVPRINLCRGLTLELFLYPQEFGREDILIFVFYIFMNLKVINTYVGGKLCKIYHFKNCFVKLKLYHMMSPSKVKS